MPKGHHLSEIIDALTALTGKLVPESFIYDFLASFGISKSIISRLKGGSINMAKKPGCTLLKDKIYFEPLRADLLKAATPAQALAAAKADAKIKASKPRFLIATDFKSLAAFDTKKGETEEFPIEDLHEHYTFFLPLAGMEKTVFQAEAEADVKAAEHMAKLYDLIRADNPPKTKEERHALNVFLTRLLFCYFAEDTGIFPGDAMFTGAVTQYTQADGSDLAHFLAELFRTLNTDSKARAKTPKHLRDFPYVNGGLFNDTHARHSEIPKFFTKSRQKLIELGTKSWKEINPDIFGSMFQGVVDDEKRAELGMHYTSVPNIMKVIKPLFLDDLYEELSKAKGSETKLKKLLARLYKLRIFDPACGSGNFLIIAYKELRRLEMDVFRELDALDKQGSLRLPGIHVSQFYGIELDDFAHEVAILALWLAEHQMNVEFKAAFGNAPASLPLKDGAKIKCGNALQVDWEKVCPKDKEHEIFVMGNPPYLGSAIQDAGQKADMAVVFKGVEDYKNLDLIAAWFFKASRYLKSAKARCAFVTTNSICQGEQVAMLWPHVFNAGVEIAFAHLSFKWTNNAKGNAGVTCVIIGMQEGPVTPKTLYANNIAKTVTNINAYLVNAKNVFISKQRVPISNLRPMTKGSGPTDGGNLILSREQRDELLEQYPECKEIVRRFVGAEDYIDGFYRYCLWMTDEQANKLKTIPILKQRLDKVRAMRLASTKAATRQDASTPHRFSEPRHEEAPSIIIPRHSSERRTYIPFGYLEKDNVVADSASAIYHAEPWIFALITSQMHMAWVRAVAGRLEERIRYSNTICYNNFPFPDISVAHKKELDVAAQEVLLERERHFPKTIAQLYDPDTMPAGLLAAHQALDATVEKCYRAKPFTSDDERLEHLFALYEKMTAEE
ncbi:MAG: class I SAM-dependent DNA methyltransferase [Verrucomicrobiaceae bacterium]|nr:class I SAM-dependent DNA methyltransferase [Verrucomicrobiaceae bacterium]